MTNEYEGALVPDLIKDAVKNALAGNEPARQRLTIIQRYINQALTTVDQNDKLGLYRRPSRTKSNAARPYFDTYNRNNGMKGKKQS